MTEYRVKVYENVTEWFNLEGKLHRTDGPAIEWIDGERLWYLNGNLHRIDGPARIWSDGHKEWYINGECLTEEEFNSRMNNSCDGKVVEIEGKKYKLTEV